MNNALFIPLISHFKHWVEIGFLEFLIDLKYIIFIEMPTKAYSKA